MARSRGRLSLALLAAALAAIAPAPARAERWTVLSWPEPYDYTGAPETVDYAPLARAARPWRICAAYPHLKDAYWISVNYGMVEQATAAGVRLTVVDAGGYPSVERQAAQVEACSREADAVVIGPVSYEGLTPLVQSIAARIPVVAAVNDMDPRGISAKVGVPWREMGRAIGSYLADRHPAGSEPVEVAWFPGPEGAGWVRFVDDGFRAGVAGSAIEISTVKWGDTGFDIQLRLIEEVLDGDRPVAYLAGSAVTADAAVSLLKARGLERRVKVVADYFTHGTFRAILRGKVLAAPTDAPVLQGRLAIDQAIRAIEGRLEHRHVGPPILMVDESNVATLPLDETLAPGSFVPRFQVP